VSTETKAKLAKATLALRDIDTALLGSSAKENAALTELLAVRKLRSEVGVSGSDASVAIQLLAQLTRAEETHDRAAAYHASLCALRADLALSLAAASREHRTAVVREALPEALAEMERDVADFELWIRGHAHSIALLKASEQNYSGDGYTARFAEILVKYGIALSLGGQ
jgi:hypothetical protein